MLTTLGYAIRNIVFVVWLAAMAALFVAAAYWLVSDAGFGAWREMTKPPAISDQGLSELRRADPLL